MRNILSICFVLIGSVSNALILTGAAINGSNTKPTLSTSVNAYSNKQDFRKNYLARQDAHCLSSKAETSVKLLGDRVCEYTGASTLFLEVTKLDELLFTNSNQCEVSFVYQSVTAIFQIGYNIGGAFAYIDLPIVSVPTNYKKIFNCSYFNIGPGSTRPVIRKKPAEPAGTFYFSKMFIGEASTTVSTYSGALKVEYFSANCTAGGCSFVTQSGIVGDGPFVSITRTALARATVAINSTVFSGPPICVGSSASSTVIQAVGVDQSSVTSTSIPVVLATSDGPFNMTCTGPAYR